MLTGCERKALWRPAIQWVLVSGLIPTAALLGGDVVIIPDNDGPGCDHKVKYQFHVTVKPPESAYWNCL